MEVRYAGWAGISQEREDMCFPLCQSAFLQVVKVKTNPVCRAVYRVNKSQWH
jgi:hypothetical protein